MATRFDPAAYRKALDAARSARAAIACSSDSDSDSDCTSISSVESDSEPCLSKVAPKQEPPKRQARKKAEPKPEAPVQPQAELPIAPPEPTGKSRSLSPDTKRYIRTKSAKYVEQEVAKHLAALQVNGRQQQPSTRDDLLFMARDRIGKKVAANAYSSVFPWG